jgi:hypothetical protein
MTIITTIEILEASIECLMLNKKHITSKVFDQFRYINLFATDFQDLFNRIYISQKDKKESPITRENRLYIETVFDNNILNDIKIIGVVEDASWVYVDFLSLKLPKTSIVTSANSPQYIDISDEIDNIYLCNQYQKVRCDRWIVSSYNNQIFKTPLEYNINRYGINHHIYKYLLEILEENQRRLFDKTKQIYVGRPF